MQISEPPALQAGQEPCRFPKLEECAHFHYEKVQLGPISVQLQTQMDQSLHSQHGSTDDTTDWYTLQVTSREECWLIQRSYENFTMLDSQFHQCIYDRKVSQLMELTMDMSEEENLEFILSSYLERFCTIIDNSLNCGPILNWFQLDNRGHRLLVPSEESRSINTPAVAAAYSVRKYVSQARDELSLEVGDMISVIDMASPGESMWWRGKRGFQVGFFPQHCVHIIGDKVPRNMPLPPPVVGSLAISPIKPVLRKHGKLITFFRSFILNRPSRRRLKQSGILRERVFGCDLGEHLLNSGHDIPMVLKCCAEFIERNGIVDGIYRLSGVTSNIQKLRNAFDEDRVPDLHTDDILQDIHSVASLLKMYFRELPNPLCTYQLYSSFVAAVQGCREGVRNKSTDNDRLLKMREAVQKLPPPHYRTLEYLMRHLAKVAKHGASTGMTTRNVAIVWAPNLLRCEELEIGGVAALQGVGVQAVVTEFLICYADLIFSDHLPNLSDTSITELQPVSPKRCRPKSLAISTPTKLLTLEEARDKHLLSKNDEGSYIEVGGGPKNLPKKYHTIIELPAGSRKRSLTKRSPSGWRSFFSKSRNNSHGNLSKNIEISPPGAIITEKSVTESDLSDIKRKLRPVKSAESLTSGQSEATPCENDVLGPLYTLNKPPGHNRSVSHDSYFDNLQSSQNNSVGSLLDLSEIQLNFDLEESEMRIFSEDESLVCSPKAERETIRKIFSRARLEEFSSAANSSNPSPKKQARVVISPESLSRKRSRIEDQLSDIQYIDCNTPENPCLISTTAVVHNQEDDISIQEQYRPKNKSPRNSHALNRHSLNFDIPEKASTTLPKSKTEIDIEKIKVPNSISGAFNLTPGGTPGTPNYKPLDNTSSDTTPILSPDLSPDVEIRYQNLDRYPLYENEELRPKSCYSLPEKRVYENVPTKSVSPTYENILTTISITYRSPVKTRASDSIYEDVELNPEKAVVPTTVAELPKQEATQPEIERPTDLDVSAEKLGDDDESNGFKSTTYKSIGSVTSTPVSLRSPVDPENSKKSLISPTEISLTEINSESSPDTSTSLSPIVKHSDVIRSKSTGSLSISSTSSSPVNLSTSASLGAVSPADAQTHNSSSNSVSDVLSPIQTPASPEPIVTTIGSTDEQSSPSFNNKFNNDKRKSCDDEILDDQNAIYQQVKYFRRSIHEINSLLDIEKVELVSTQGETDAARAETDNEIGNNDEDQMDSIENFDSLEADNGHIYENVDSSKKLKDLDDPRTRMHESEPKKLEIAAEEVRELPVCSKCLPVEPETCNVKILTNKFEKTKDETEEVKKPKSYDKDGLPPCLRAKNAKNSVKTKSLDENAFITEFGRDVQQLTRRKSLDDRTSSYINSKMLVEPKLPSRSTLDVSQIDKKVECVGTEHKLNRERIEKYKEERRNQLREKYRSESFREDKEKVLLGLKQRSFREDKDVMLLGVYPKSFRRSRSKIGSECNVSDNEINSHVGTNNSGYEISSNETDSNAGNDISSIEKKVDQTEHKAGSSEKKIGHIESKDSDLAKKCISECNSEHKNKEQKNSLERKTNSVVNKTNDIGNKVINVENKNNIDSEYKQVDKSTDVETKATNSYKKLSVETLSKFEQAAKPPKKHHSPSLELRNKTLKEISDKLLDDSNDDVSITSKEEEFIRHRRGDSESEKKRHTFEVNKVNTVREFDGETLRRISLDSRIVRKEKCSPSYCIKDMKAIFEPKSACTTSTQQNQH